MRNQEKMDYHTQVRAQRLRHRAGTCCDLASAQHATKILLWHDQVRGDIMVLGATNRPDLVDAALLRPGRFDIRMYVPPPDSADARCAILGALTQKTPLDPDVALPALAELTAGWGTSQPCWY